MSILHYLSPVSRKMDMIGRDFMRKIDKLTKRYLWPLVVFNQMILRKKSFLNSTGWIESLKRGYACRKNGSELPWMNYSIIGLLEDRLQKEHSIFEFGSGASTQFFARLVSRVVSIEYDKVWFSLITDRLPGNATVLYREKDYDGKYCRSIRETDESYDGVIVDGRDRVNCVKQSLESLSERGVVILDDSHRAQYQDAIDFAMKRGFRALPMEGLKPTGTGIDRSTIFYRDGNCLGI